MTRLLCLAALALFTHHFSLITSSQAADRPNILWITSEDHSPNMGCYGDKFASTPSRPGLGGVPLIECCAAYLECSHETELPGGDHAIFIGRVERFEKAHDATPLAFGGGKYLVAKPHENSALS